MTIAESFSIEAILSAVDQGFTSTMSKASGAVSGLTKSMNPIKSIGGAIGKAFSGVGNIAKFAVGITAVQKGISALTQGVQGGVQRFDTMQKYPRMMEQMGYSALDAESSINKLSDGIEGLPTALDEIVGTTQLLTMMTGDMDKATDIALGMNNAFLSSGASTADASRGMQQFNQMLSKGKVDMMAWNTLVETMSPSIRKLNQELGYSENDMYAIYEALQAGEITFSDFTDAVIRANEAQGGFAETALENSRGIGTSMANLRTAISRGWAGVLEAMDEGLKGMGFDGLLGVIDKVKPAIDRAFAGITDAVTGAFNIMQKVMPHWNRFKLVMENAFRMFGEGDYVGGITKVGQAFTEVFDKVNDAMLNWANASSWGEVGANIGKNITNSIRTAFDTLRGVDWGNAFWDSLYSIQDFLHSIVTNTDLKMIGTNIGSLIQDALSGTVTHVFDLLLVADSKLYQGQEEFHASVMSLIDGLLQGLFEDTIVEEVLISLEARPLFSYDRWAEGINDARNYFQKSFINLMNEVQQWTKAWNNPEIETEVQLQISILESEGFTEAERQEIIDDMFGEGTYEAQMNVRPSLNIEEVDYEQTLTSILTAYGDGAVEFTQDVQANIKLYEGQGFSEDKIRELIDGRFGHGVYDFVVQASAMIEELELQGMDEAQIQAEIDARFGKGAYEVLVDINATPDVTVTTGNTITGHSAGGTTSLDAQFENLIQSMVSKDPIPVKVAVKPEFTLGTMGSGGISGGEGQATEMPNPLEGLISKIQASLSQIQSAVTDAMVQITSSVTTALSTITASIAAITVTLTVTFTAINAVLLLGATTMMTTLQSTVDKALTAIQDAITSALSAITEGISQMVQAFEEGAQTVVEVANQMKDDVIAVMEGVADAMHTAGANAGQGFADGLASKAGEINAVAASLANSASQTIQSALIMASPSKLWYRFGEFTGEGFALGMESQIQNVKDASNKLAVASLPEISQRNMKYSNSGSFTLDDNMTLVNEIRSLKSAVESGQVILLDGDSLVGGTSNRMNRALGSQISLGRRGRFA